MASSSSCQQLVGASQPARLHWSLVLAVCFFSLCLSPLSRSLSLPLSLFLSPASISGEPGPLIHIQSKSQAPGSSRHHLHHIPPIVSIICTPKLPLPCWLPLSESKGCPSNHPFTTHTNRHTPLTQLLNFLSTWIQLEHKSELKTPSRRWHNPTDGLNHPMMAREREGRGLCALAD